MKRTPLRRAGKKTKEWDRVRAKLKVKFEAAGITRCEECGTGLYLGLAHRLKRRNITTPEELERVALLCTGHHMKLELLPEAEMAERIDAIISRREFPIM